ncbi:DEKNAAC100776 [Brettanomyces naardenensis]|uniref:DEKNAAC100776 n=1 Tax=Brettanomyces naardenensis TaxID=13370 RepID=A0A448YGB8_BRENA|nr:DEKNAAC100776 [Brettanomyces naardenensis]
MSSVLLLLHPTMATEPMTVEETKCQLRAKHPDSQLSQFVIDRVASGKQELPSDSFSLIYYLAPEGAKKNKFNGPLTESLFNSLKPEGVFEGLIPNNCDLLAIKAGFLVSDDGSKWIKPSVTNTAVLLKKHSTKAKSCGLPSFSRKETIVTPNLTDSSSDDLEDIEPEELDLGSKDKESKLGYFDESGDDDDDDEDDNISSDGDLLDEDQLLNSADLAEPTIAPVKCTRTGKKRRRACKDCTCGLKEEEEKEEARHRSLQDTVLGNMARSANEEAEAIERRIRRREQRKGKVVKFKPEEMNEIDFTVEGKTGGCGSCALGDAFRCDSCPYLGLPAFKPGQPISLDAFGEDI